MPFFIIIPLSIYFLGLSSPAPPLPFFHSLSCRQGLRTGRRWRRRPPSRPVPSRPPWRARPARRRRAGGCRAWRVAALHPVSPGQGLFSIHRHSSKSRFVPLVRLCRDGRPRGRAALARSPPVGRDRYLIGSLLAQRRRRRRRRLITGLPLRGSGLPGTGVAQSCFRPRAGAESPFPVSSRPGRRGEKHSPSAGRSFCPHLPPTPPRSPGTGLHPEKASPRTRPASEGRRSRRPLKKVSRLPDKRSPWPRPTWPRPT